MKDIARPDIKPAFAERNVPVVFATDEKYLPYVGVAVNSAIASSVRCNLDILILHAGIGDGAIRDFVTRYVGIDNVSVRFVDISGELEASGLSDYKQTGRLPMSSCYRLLLPRTLPEYGKIVYIDVDVVVCRDLGELYSTDIGNNWFAAAKDVVYITKPEYVSWASKWGFTEWDGYVNAGVMVMNLERFRNEPIIDKLKAIVMEAAEWCCDQDALNFVCKNAIAPLDPRWNVQLGDYCLKEQIALTGDEMWIAHFTGGQKPWKRPARRYSHLWWRHADPSDISRLWARTWGATPVSSVAATPKLSVVMPVFNAQLYLSEALASVLMQKEIPEIEVICIDDGSADDSAAILEFWKDRDPRLKVLRQENHGPGVARNAGLDAAKGEYIFFLDADDRLASGDVLLRAYEQAKQDRLDMLLAASSTIAEDGRILKVNARLDSDIPQEPVFAPEALGAGLFLCTNMAPWGKLYRRAFLEENKLRFPPLKRSEDFPMVELALAVATRIGVLRQSISERRIGVTTSLESTKDETPLIFFEAEQLFRDSLRKRRLWAQFKMAVYSAFVTRLAYNLRAVRNYSSFRDIIAKYRQECRQWIRWDGVAMSECHSESLQLVKEIEKEMDENDQIALFVKLKEANAVAQTKATLRQLDAAQKSRSKALEGFLKMRGERDEAREDRNRWKRDRDRVLAEKEKLFAQLNKQEQLIEVVRGEREKAKEDRNRWKRDRDRVLAEKEKLFAQLNKQEQLIEVVRGERENAKEDRNRWKKDRDRVLAEREKLVAQLDKQEQLIEVIRGERKKANEERARWKKDRDRVLAENEKLTASKKTCMKENKDLQNECRRLAAELDRNRKTLEKLSSIVGM